MNKIEHRTLKIMIIGSSGVGKTSLIRKFDKLFTIDDQNDEFISFISEIEIDRKKYSVIIEEFNIGGAIKYRDKFLFASKSYIKTANSVIFIFDISNISIFDNFSQLLYNIKKSDELYSELKIPFFVLGNKVDVNDREISKEETKIIENNLEHGKYFECSTKTGYKVKEIFDMIMNEVINKI